MKIILGLAALAVCCMGIGWLSASILDGRKAEIHELHAQVRELEAKNAALEASRRALEAARAENVLREVENAAALEKITAGALADDEYFAAVLGLLRKAFEPSGADSASRAYERLRGSGSQ